MALVGDDLYVANTDALMRFPYQDGRDADRGAGRKVVDLPAGPINHHWTKNIIASRGRHEALRDGRLEQQRRRERHATRKRAAPRSGRSIPRPASSRIFASGLRNPNGLGWEPADRSAVDRRQRARRARQRPGARLHDGGAGRRLLRLALQLLTASTSTTRVKPQRPDLVAKALVPDYALGAAHRLAGPRLLRGQLLAARTIAGGAFVGQHGSWNREPRSGYKVIFVPFKDGQPSGRPRTC